MSKLEEQMKQGEANVLLELRSTVGISEEVLDANSDDVLRAVEKHGAHIALGAVVSINVHEAAIKLRFDVPAESFSEASERIAELVKIIENNTDIRVKSTRSEVDTGADDEEAPTGEFASC